MTRVVAVLACMVAATVAAASEPAPGRPPPAVVDLNSACRAELMTVVTDREARAIIAGRPWRSKADLVEKKVIPEGKYVAIRRRIMARQPLPEAQGRTPTR